MRRKASRGALSTLILLGTLALAFRAQAGSRDLVILHAGGAPPSDPARAEIDRLMAAIVHRAGWPEGSARARYYHRSADALAAIREDPPGFLLTSPGFFLKHHERLGLAPLNQVVLQGSTHGSYTLVTRKGGPSSLEELKGGTLAGAALAEPAFVERIVLKRRLRFGQDLEVRQMRSLRALRKLLAGELDAVILDGKEQRALPALPFADDLVTLYTSDPVPYTGLMALPSAKTEDREAITAALDGLCESEEGASICRTYGIEGFRPAGADTFQALISTYGAP